MIKVLVYGGKKNALSIGQFLEQRIPVEVNVMTSRMEFSELSTAQIVKETEDALCSQIGRNELIVLADPLDAVVAEETLRTRYPRQKFVCYGQGLTRIIQRLEAVYILVALKIRRLELYQRIKAQCQKTEIRETEGQEWKKLIENRRRTKEEVMRTVRLAQGAPIVVFHPDFSCSEIKEIVDWRNEVIDLEEEILKSAKAELGLMKWC